jgi:hypothetical protein
MQFECHLIFLQEQFKLFDNFNVLNLKLSLMEYAMTLKLCKNLKHNLINMYKLKILSIFNPYTISINLR